MLGEDGTLVSVVWCGFVSSLAEEFHGDGDPSFCLVVSKGKKVGISLL